MDEPVVLPITDELDLHTFRPKEIPDLLIDYFEACLAKGITRVRVVHGKGTGVLKKRVQSLLQKNPFVVSFRDAGMDAGGWGATIVELKPK